MKSPKTKKNCIVLSVSCLCLLFLALIWLSYLRQRSFDKKDAIQFAIEKNSNLSVALEQYAIRTLHNADAVLQIVKLEYAIEGDSLNLQKLLKTSSLNRDIIEGVAIIDSNGKLKMTNIPLQKKGRPDFSDRSYFIFHSCNNTDSLLISKPLLSKTIGKPVIVISRRLNDLKGRFAGVVALQIEPSAFTAFYANANLLSNDIISLISPDGITYARRTGNKESSGEDISKSPLFKHLSHNADSFYFAKDAIKNIPSWFSYRKLQKYPIIATVGSSQHDILLDYASKQPRYVTARIIISGLLILFSFLLAIILVHRNNLARRMAKEEERYQRLLTEQMIAVQEREREWIGRELHDNVNQVLTTVKLYLETASAQQNNPLVDRSMRLINGTIGEIRNLSHQLSAPTLGTRSLIDSINALIEMIEFSNHIEFEFDHSGYGQSIAMNQKLAVYRILQEQLNNIIKHAQATRVSIYLNQRDNFVILTVKDNGKGFDSTAKAKGMGLNNITSRAKVFGGVVEIKSSPGKGCSLKVVLPVERVNFATA